MVPRIPGRHAPDRPRHDRAHSQVRAAGTPSQRPRHRGDRARSSGTREDEPRRPRHHRRIRRGRASRGGSLSRDPAHRFGPSGHTPFHPRPQHGLLCGQTLHHPLRGHGRRRRPCGDREPAPGRGRIRQVPGPDPGQDEGAPLRQPHAEQDGPRELRQEIQGAGLEEPLALPGPGGHRGLQLGPALQLQVHSVRLQGPFHAHQEGCERPGHREDPEGTPGHPAVRIEGSRRRRREGCREGQKVPGEGRPAPRDEALRGREARADERDQPRRGLRRHRRLALRQGVTAISARARRNTCTASRSRGTCVPPRSRPRSSSIRV